MLTVDERLPAGRGERRRTAGELDQGAPVPDSGGMETDVRATAGEAAGSLRAIVGVIDAGELVADEAQRAYLSGAADALESVASAVFEHRSMR